MSQDLPTGPSQPTDYDRVKAIETAARDERARRAKEIEWMMEPAAHGCSVTSQAISLKRIADLLEKMNAPPLRPEPLYGDMLGNLRYVGAGDPPPDGGPR